MGQVAVHRQDHVAGQQTGALGRRARQGAEDDDVVVLVGNAGADAFEVRGFAAQ